MLIDGHMVAAGFEINGGKGQIYDSITATCRDQPFAAGIVGIV